MLPDKEPINQKMYALLEEQPAVYKALFSGFNKMLDEVIFDRFERLLPAPNYDEERMYIPDNGTCQ